MEFNEGGKIPGLRDMELTHIKSWRYGGYPQKVLEIWSLPTESLRYMEVTHKKS